MSDVVTLISRVLLSALFVVYGYFKFLDVTSFTNLPGAKRLMDVVATGAAVPDWLGYLVAALEVLSGVAILIGFKTRWVAWGLVVYVILATWLGHPFWLLEGASRGANQTHFYKNLAIIGGFLLLTITGPGRYSVDGSTARTRNGGGTALHSG